MRRWLLLALAAAISGCGSDEPLAPSLLPATTHDGGSSSPLDAGRPGSRDAPALESSAPPSALDLQPGYYLGLEKAFLPLDEAAALELVQAPQGGHAAFVGARIRHAKSAIVTMRVRLRDPVSGDVVMEDERKGPIAPSKDLPGWSEPDPDARGAINHLVACPVWKTQLLGASWTLEVEVEEQGGGGLSGMRSLPVDVTCAAISAYRKTYCECECETGYVPGTCNLPY